MFQTKITNRGGFTLMEMMVVISILAILAGGLIAGYGKAQKAAWTSRSQSLVAQTATAWNAYLLRYQTWPTTLKDAMEPTMCKIIAGGDGGQRFMDLAYDGLKIASSGNNNVEVRYGLLDAWGQMKAKRGEAFSPDQYQIQVRFDKNYDGVIDTSEGSPDKEIRASVIAWSWGHPDGQTGFLRDVNDFSKLKTKSWVSNR